VLVLCWVLRAKFHEPEDGSVLRIARHYLEEILRGISLISTPSLFICGAHCGKSLNMSGPRNRTLEKQNPMCSLCSFFLRFSQFSGIEPEEALAARLGEILLEVVSGGRTRNEGHDTPDKPPRSHQSYFDHLWFGYDPKNVEGVPWLVPQPRHAMFTQACDVPQECCNSDPGRNLVELFGTNSPLTRTAQADRHCWNPTREESPMVLSITS